MSSHCLLELRTSRNAEHTAETAIQLFGTLPTLKNNIFQKILGKDERISFEIVVQNQTIYFVCFTPTRLLEYVAGLIQSSYPEVMITVLERDYLDFFLPTTPQEKGENQSYLEQRSHFRTLGWLQLKHPQYFPLKNFHDFPDTDPLAPLLSTLSKTHPFDQICVQFCLRHSNERWKNKGLSLASGTTNSTTGTQTTHPQKSLIEKKISSKSLKTSIRLLTVSDSQTRSELLIDTIGAAFQSTTQSEGNQLVLKKRHIFKKQFMSQLQHRSLAGIPSFHLSLEELATLYHLPNKKLSHIRNIAWGKQLLGEPPEDLPIVNRETPNEIKKDINVFAKTIYKNSETIYGIKRYDRRKHMYVIGKTGTGKSTLLANMAINDLKNDEGLCVIDPHGDLVEILLNYIPSRRINDVVYFDPADKERTVKINLFEDENVAHRELIASGIVSIFHKLYSYSWGPRLEYILRNTLLTLLASKTSRMSDIVDLLTNKKLRERVVEELNDPILKNFWLHEFGKMPDRQRTDAIAPILNKVGQFVSSPLVRDVVNAHSSSFSIEDVMNQGKILLVNLSQGRLGEDNATMLGAMLITKIQLSAMARVHIPEEERKDFYLYVDEFQNFATESFNKILSEARKYRLNLILANQYIAQIPEEVQKAIFGNCGSMSSFIMGADDAQVFEKEYGGRYSHEDLVSLGRYQIINKLSIDNVTSHPFPAHTLPIAKSRNKNREKVIRVSRERYAKKK